MPQNEDHPVYPYEPPDPYAGNPGSDSERLREYERQRLIREYGPPTAEDYYLAEQRRRDKGYAGNP